MRIMLLGLLIVALCVASASAGTTRHPSHMAPTGKGWGEDHDDAPPPSKPASGAVTTGNGISYHGGPIMPGTVNIYYIWYGKWSKGLKPSDSATTVNLLNALVGDLSGSGYELINSTYGDNTYNVTGNVMLSRTTIDSYSHGTRLRDSSVQAVVASAINSGSLPKDPNGVYFVLTSSDVSEMSGFCTKYCGWHTHGTINSVDIKYAFVGNPDRCPSACEAQTNSPNGNSGADGMASIIAHELEEAISDPDLNAWYDSSGFENADKCAWKFGPTQATGSGAAYNQTLAGYNWLIQMNWQNSCGGGCAQTLQNPQSPPCLFYNQ